MQTLTREHVREIDRRTAGEFGIPTLTLMENAGRACAELFVKLYPEPKPAHFLCGPGNNGGDGFVMARYLIGMRRRVSVFADAALFDRMPSDAAVNLTRLREMNVRVNAFSEAEFHDAVIVDALFGIGLTRPLRDPFAAVVTAVNASGRPIFAVDAPSGLDCNTGLAMGTCVKAHHTATFVAPKSGFTNKASIAYTGEVHVLDIGVPQVLLNEYS